MKTIALFSNIAFCFGFYGSCFYLLFFFPIQIHIKQLSVWIGKEMNSTPKKYIHPKDFKVTFNQTNLSRDAFLSLPHFLLRERAISPVWDIYSDSPHLQIIFLIFYLLSYFMNNLQYQSVPK